MTGTFYGPDLKSDIYWQREHCVAGRIINDANDAAEQERARLAMEALGQASPFLREMHRELWKADEADKAFWRAHFRRTGELLTPAEHHRLDADEAPRLPFGVGR